MERAFPAVAPLLRGAFVEKGTKEKMNGPSAEDKMKLFLLHIVLLNKLPLKCRAHFIDEKLLNEFCRAKDGNVFPFNEVSKVM